MIELMDREIQQVDGGVVPYSYLAPNGITYENIVKVTTHYWEDVDGAREYFVDAAASWGIPAYLAASQLNALFSAYQGQF